MEKRYILTYRGDKAGLHKLLKIKCAETNESMNERIVDLVEEDLRRYYRDEFETRLLKEQQKQLNK